MRNKAALPPARWSRELLPKAVLGTRGHEGVKRSVQHSDVIATIIMSLSSSPPPLLQFSGTWGYLLIYNKRGSKLHIKIRRLQNVVCVQLKLKARLQKASLVVLASVPLSLPPMTGCL